MDTTMQKIQALMGHVENGTDRIVTIFQDDATKCYILKVRGVDPKQEKEYWDRSLEEVIDKAYDSLIIHTA